MTLEQLLVLLIGGGGAAGLLSAFFTRKSGKEKTDIDLLDRAYKEIERIDAKLKEAYAELELEKGENENLKNIIEGMKRDKTKLEKIIRKLKEGREQ
ncbi:acyl-ACP--UDP-N-acetylglucosamine O-acyltransferase family protein [Carnobacterium antarcticum]|uniref:Uncharacterized protein n=1 Tax=Carnobacterium antarcticum TaxID=2126436 RepID=A0ABW4NMJ8_9LACT|nr:hypothetical protein [Carnobacterium sp. CP1]ALV20773.1 hypothetical protein NY10_148 [Carnobacterium sp. CP1]